MRRCVSMLGACRSDRTEPLSGPSTRLCSCRTRRSGRGDLIIMAPRRVASVEPEQGPSAGRQVEHLERRPAIARDSVHDVASAGRTQDRIAYAAIVIARKAVRPSTRFEPKRPADQVRQRRSRTPSNDVQKARTIAQRDPLARVAVAPPSSARRRRAAHGIPRSAPQMAAPGGARMPIDQRAHGRAPGERFSTPRTRRRTTQRSAYAPFVAREIV